MSRTAKLTIILLCFSICGTGGFIASTVREKREPQKANVMPVKNHQTPNRFWIRA
jgi:hypothetical protein